MIGTAVVSLPWAFQQSGMLLGCLITFASFVVGLYTCILIVNATGTDADYSVTAKKYYGNLCQTYALGNFGFYAALLCPAVLILGAVVVYYVLLCQSLYPLLLAIYALCSSTKPPEQQKPLWNTFSTAYVALALFPILIWLCSKKDLSIFRRIGSFGIVFVVMIMLFIIGVGILAMTNTTFELGSYKPHS